MKKTISLLTCLILLSINFLNAQTTSSAYRIANKIHVDGDGGWDYITSDDETGRLFVSHASMVQVVDAAQQKVVGTIPDTKGVHGIALAPDLNKGFVSCGKDSSVTVFDLKTLAVIEKVIVTGRNPDCIVYDVYTHRVLTFNGGSSNATVIDAKTDKVLGTIALNGRPEFAVSNDKGNIYVNLEDKSSVLTIYPATMKTGTEVSLKPGDGPSGMAIDKANNILFIVCDNKLMMILDATTGKIITSVPISDHPDAAAFDPSLKRAYSSNGDGTLTVVQEENATTFKVLENATTQKGARTMAVNTKTHHVFLPAADYGEKPAASADNPHQRPPVKPGSFVILEVTNGK